MSGLRSRVFLKLPLWWRYRDLMRSNLYQTQRWRGRVELLDCMNVGPGRKIVHKVVFSWDGNGGFFFFRRRRRFSVVFPRAMVHHSNRLTPNFGDRKIRGIRPTLRNKSSLRTTEKRLAGWPVTRRPTTAQPQVLTIEYFRSSEAIPIVFVDEWE